MHVNTRCCLGLCVTSLFALTAIVAVTLNGSEVQGRQKGKTASKQVQKVSFHDLVNQAFNLGQSQLLQLDVDSTPEQPLTLNLTIDGLPYTLDLQPFSIRTPDYKLLIATENPGEYIDADPGPVRTLRGSLREDPTSIAAGALMHDGLRVMIVKDNNTDRVWIEPTLEMVNGANANDYVLYRGDDAINDTNLICGNVDAWAEGGPADQGGVAGSGPACFEDAIRCTEFLGDSDIRFYERYLGPPADALTHATRIATRMNLILNTVNVQYERDCCIRHIANAMVVRPTGGNDPYAGENDSNTLNVILRGVWQSNNPNHDIGVLYSGATSFQDNTGGTVVIGQASGIGTICGSLRYCVNSSFSSSYSCISDLYAHEMGHCWGSHHCGCPDTMFAVAGACVNIFMAPSFGQIIAHREDRTCLDTCSELTTTLPFFDDFPNTHVSYSRWSQSDGEPSNEGINIPSGNFAYRLHGNETGGTILETRKIPLIGGTDFVLSYWYQRTGAGNSPEAGDDLIVEFLHSSGTWQELDRKFGSGADMTTFEQVHIKLGHEALHGDFRVRFRCISTTSSGSQPGSDDWFIDDVSMTYVAPPGNQFCPNATIVGTSNSSTPFSTIGALTDGPDEPGDCNFGGQTQFDHDIWFRIASTCNGEITVSVCDTDFDTRLAVYSTCPSGAGESLVCSDNLCNLDPEVKFNGVFGGQYRVRVGGNNGEWGNGTLQVRCNDAGTCLCPAATCPGDIVESNSINVDDLLALIGQWGSCVGCTADLSPPGGNNQVNVDDLLRLISLWGPCP